MENILKIKDLKSNLFLGDYGEEITGYNSGYIGDIVTEIADNNVDIYYSDLNEWTKDNANYIEEALDEFGTPTDGNGHADYYGMIRQGQFIAYERELYENLEDILKYWAYDYIEDNYKLTELTEEQNDEVEFLNYNNFEKLEDIVAELESIFESEAE